MKFYLKLKSLPSRRFCLQSVCHFAQASMYQISTYWVHGHWPGLNHWIMNSGRWRWKKCIWRSAKWQPSHHLFPSLGVLANCGLMSSDISEVYSLRPSDAIWRHRSGSTLAQVMACCLTAPSHYMTNVDWSSVRSCGIHVWTISQETPHWVTSAINHQN